jgi:threonine aldolase
MNFASDNTAGIAPRIAHALAGANEGFALGYGNDALTQKVERTFAAAFEREVAVFLVPTGTAANALALAHVSPPWGAVLCHEQAHAITDECGAPEFFGGGLRLVGLPGEGGKLAPPVLQQALAGELWGGPHHVSPSVLSLTQATEAGTIYRPDEVHALAALAHARALAVHMDGARLANALVRLGVSAAEMTWKSGVDVLSLGATKAGALAAEAIVFFDPARAAGMAERRKRGGHLLSKHRFIAVQFAAFFGDDYWRALARHANAMADILAARLTAGGVVPVWPVQANIVFVILPAERVARLREAGASFYVRRSSGLPAGIGVGRDDALLRLVTSYATSEDEVRRFVELACQ